MGTPTVDFRKDIEPIRKHLAARVATQFKTRTPVSGITVGFQLNQAGFVVVHFDVRDKHERDGSWTDAMGGATLKMPQWRRAYEAAGGKGVAFVMPDGKAQDLPPDAGDGKVAGVFGMVLFAIVRDAISSGVFASLPLRDECQLDMEEFDGMWAWPEFDDLGRTNIIQKMRPVKLRG